MNSISARLSMLLSSLFLSACLENIETKPLPPLAEEYRYDGSMYEPPTSNTSSENGYGYASESSTAYGTQTSPDDSEDTP